MGICNKGAGLLAPLVFGSLVMRGVGDFGSRVAVAATPAAREGLLDELATRVHLPYLAMAGLLALLGVAGLRSPLPELRGSSAKGQAGATDRPLRSYPQIWFGVACLVLYMGAEVMAGDAIGTYGAAFGLPVTRTAYFTSLTLAGMLLGYVVGLIATPRFVSQQRYLAISALVGLVLVAAAFLTRGYVSVACVAGLGFANAMMWPAIFPLAIRGLGLHTETASALLVMAICGGAVVPQLFAILKQTYSFQSVFAGLMLPIYIYILVFAEAVPRSRYR
jgi:glucose/galactose transporter